MSTSSTVSSFIAATASVVTVLAGGPALASAGSHSPQRSGAHPATLYVSRHGKDTAHGGKNHPLRTIQAAVDRSPANGHIVVRPGLYHESVSIGGKDGLSIRASKRGSVWLDGTSRVRSWERTGNVWVHKNWHHEFNASPTFTWNAPANPAPNWGFVNPAHPMAAHPDQVFVDGHSLQQVGSLSAVRHGTFYVDYGTHQLYLGTDPTARAVRASTLEKAMTIRSARVHVDGLDVRGFAPSLPDVGAITVGGAHDTLSRMLVRDMSTTGVFVGGTDVHLKSMVFRHNGLLGFMATHADGLRVSRATSLNNNAELFNMAPAAGGAKIWGTSNVVVRNSTFARNHATGLWFDGADYNVRVYNSRMLDNAGHGLSLEISSVGVVADNVIADNAGNGIKVNDTDHVQLWNNTFVGNAEPVNVAQDNRDGKSGTLAGRPPMPWLIQHIAVHNNIVARPGPGSDCLVCIQDHTHRFTAEYLDVTTDGNVYQRHAKDSPQTLVLWSRGANPASLFSNVHAFHAATGQESTHLALNGKPAVGSNYRPTPRVSGKAAETAVPLPSWLARALHQSTGTRHLGAWFD